AEHHAVVLGVLHPLDEAGRFEQGLRRDAAAMEARPADLVLVDEGDLQAELGRPEGGRVAARARAEHDEIEVIGGADGHRVSTPREPRTGAARPPVGRGESTAAVVRGPFGTPQPNPGSGGIWAAPNRPNSGARLAPFRAPECDQWSGMD